jgi:hypothetical protein
MRNKENLINKNIQLINNLSYGWFEGDYGEWKPEKWRLETEERRKERKNYCSNLLY